jgi:hypothetical protein
MESNEMNPLFVSPEIIDEKSATAHAVMEYLRLYPSGDPMPLSILDLFHYGTYNNRLIQRIKNLRLEAQTIAEEILGIQEEGFGDVTDSTLIQKFVLEQFTLVKRYVLRFTFEDMAFGIYQTTIDFWSWFVAWVLTIFRYVE